MHPGSAQACEFAPWSKWQANNGEVAQIGKPSSVSLMLVIARENNLSNLPFVRATWNGASCVLAALLPSSRIDTLSEPAGPIR